MPLVTVITRKAYGGAYDVMGSKHLGADVNLAWPTAQIAVMGAQGAVNILYRRELAKSEDPDAQRAELIADYEHTLANPYIAAERGYIDAVIRPSETRAQITKALRALRTKRADAAAQEAREHPAVSTEAGTTTAPDEAAARPVLRVVHGTPDAVELAALVAVVTAMAARRRPTAPHRRARRGPRRTGSSASRCPSGGWRASFAPR